MSKRHRPPRNAFRSFRKKPFELRSALSQLVGKPSLIGDIASTLYDRKRQPLSAIIDAPVVDLATTLWRAPWRLLCAAISSIRLPSDRVWLEFIRNGVRIGLLAQNRLDGTILVRRAQFVEAGLSVATLSMCVSVRPSATPVAVAWNDDWSRLEADPGEDARWGLWFNANVQALYPPSAKPSLTEHAMFLGEFALPDLALVALACSPLVAAAWVDFRSDGSCLPVAEGAA
jgi:hypothetical protein